MALFTGLAQLSSLYLLNYLMENFDAEVSGQFGLIDSMVLMLSGIISFGVQLSINRNVTAQKNWRSNYNLGQSSRVYVSIIILAAGLLSILWGWDKTKLVFLMAPFVALNGDYALYGHGKPIRASMLSFFRVGIPNFGVLAIIWFTDLDIITAYIVLLAVGIFNSGFFASKINEVSYLFLPSKKFLRFYLKYYKVGIFQMSSAFLITGILWFSRLFYELAVIGLVYGILKYFEVFKGVMRILVQSYFKDIRLNTIALKIDKFGMIIGGFLIIPTIFYADVTLALIYEQTYKGLEWMMMLFGAAMVVASIKPSCDIRLLLMKRDNTNVLGYLSAGILAMVTVMIFSFSDYYMYGIPSAILLAEITLLIILGYKESGMSFFIHRLTFLLKLSPIFILILSLYLFTPKGIISLATGCALYILFVSVLFRKVIFDRPVAKNT